MRQAKAQKVMHRRIEAVKKKNAEALEEAQNALVRMKKGIPGQIEVGPPTEEMEPGEDLVPGPEGEDDQGEDEQMHSDTENQGEEGGGEEGEDEGGEYEGGEEGMYVVSFGLTY